MQKRIFSVWMAAVLLLLCLPLSVSAEEVDSGPFPVVDAGFAGENTIHILALDDAFATPSDADYGTASVYYSKNAEESPRYTTCPIIWDFEQIDSSAPGFFTLEGTVELTDNLVPDEGVYPDGAVTVPLSYYVYDPADPATKLPIQMIFFDDELQYNMNQGADVSLLDLPVDAYGAFFYKNFQELVDCGVVWDYDSFDASTPGKQTLYGDILPPEAFCVGDNIETGEPLRAECTVFVSDVDVPAETTIIYGYGYRTNAHRVIPLGMDAQELAASFEKRLDPSLQFQFTTEDRVDFSCNYEIDTTKIGTTEIGVYYPLRLIDFHSHVILDQAVKEMTAVYVVDPNEVDLRCVQYYPSTGKLDMNWIYAAVAPTLWAKVDAGDWEPVDDTIYGVYSQSGNAGVQGMFIRLGLLDPGHQYEFEVRYETGKYSVNTLVVDLTEGAPVIYDTPIDGDRHGYDRDDGSDDNTDGDDTDNGDSTPPGNGDTGSSGGGTPGDGDTGNNGTPPGDDNTGDNAGSTPGDGDTGSGESGGGNPDSTPQIPVPDHSDGKGDAAGLPTEDSVDPKAEQTQLAQPVSVTVAETKVPAAKEPVIPSEDQPVASGQAGTAEPTQPSEHSSKVPEQSTLQPPAVDLEQAEPQPAEITAARSEPVSAALPIALGVGGLVCGVAFWWLRKRVKL